MTKYLFKNRSDLEDVLALASEDRPRPIGEVGVRRQGALTTGWLFMTPEGGIPAATGTPSVCGKAQCVPHFINESDEITELESDFDGPITVEVLNVFSSPIAGDTLITAKEVYRKIVADAEDCKISPVYGSGASPESLSYGDGETM